MDADVVKAFNKALISMMDSKSPVSKQKIMDITKAALGAVRYFKHVVLIVEKFLVKCRTEYRVSGLYVIDSIVRQARKQYLHKDVFAPRFATNLPNTIANVLGCDSSERLKVVRVINLWAANKIFDPDVLEPVLQHCRAMGLEVEPYKVERLVKGDKANLKLYGSPAASSSRGQRSVPRTPPLELRPHTPQPSSISFDAQEFDSTFAPTNGLSGSDALLLIQQQDPNIGQIIANSTNRELMRRAQRLINDRIQEALDIERRRQGNLKDLLARDFDYSDEEEAADGNGEAELRGHNPADSKAPQAPKTREEVLALAQGLFTSIGGAGRGSSIRQELHQLISELIGGGRAPPPAAVVPVFNPLLPPPNFTPMPPVNGGAFPVRMPQMDFSKPPPSLYQQGGATNGSPSKPMASAPPNNTLHQPFGNKPSSSSSSHSKERVDRRDSRKRDRDRSRSRERDRTTTKRDKRSRSPRKSERDTSRERSDRSRELERERRRNGFPSHPRDDHLLIGSRTIWIGRLPTNCSEADINEAVKEAGTPEQVKIVAPRGCAYVTMEDRRSAFKIMDKLARDLQVARKTVKLSWASIQGLKEDERLMDYWDSEKGFAQIPFSRLPDRLEQLMDGAYLDVHTLPSHLKGQYDAKGPRLQAQIPLPAEAQAILLPPNVPPPPPLPMLMSGFPFNPMPPPPMDFQQPPPGAFSGFRMQLPPPPANTNNGPGPRTPLLRHPFQQQPIPGYAHGGVFNRAPPPIGGGVAPRMPFRPSLLGEMPPSFAAPSPSITEGEDANGSEFHGAFNQLPPPFRHPFVPPNMSVPPPVTMVVTVPARMPRRPSRFSDADEPIQQGTHEVVVVVGGGGGPAEQKEEAPPGNSPLLPKEKEQKEEVISGFIQYGNEEAPPGTSPPLPPMKEGANEHVEEEN